MNGHSAFSHVRLVRTAFGFSAHDSQLWVCDITVCLWHTVNLWGQRRHITCSDLQVGFLEQRTIRTGSYQAWCANKQCCKLEPSVHHSTLRWHTDGHDALTLIQRGYHHIERDDHSVAQQMSLPVFCTLWIRIGYKNLKYAVPVCKSDFTTVIKMLIALFPLINWSGSSPLCQIPIYWYYYCCFTRSLSYDILIKNYEVFF